MVFTPNHAKSRWITLNHAASYLLCLFPSRCIHEIFQWVQAQWGENSCIGNTFIVPLWFLNFWPHDDGFLYQVSCNARQAWSRGYFICFHLKTLPIHMPSPLQYFPGMWHNWKENKQIVHINASKNLHTLSPPRLHMLYVIFKIIPPLPQCGTRPLHFSHSDLFFIETRN